MKLKKLFVSALATALIIATIPNIGMINKKEVAASSAAVTQIPGTTRSFSSYNDSFLSVTGFASGGVNDRSSYIGTSYYVKVTTEREFLQALLNAKNGTVKVIEIQNDLNLGYLELGLSTAEASKYSIISKYGDPTNGYTNPILEASGVSKLNISNTDGLTIFSSNGSTLKHVELKLQGTSNDIVIRNLSFDGMYQFDDTGLHKEVGWTFIKENGANNVWIDHCSFAIAADGMLDVENGSSGLTLSWCKFGLEADENPSSSSDIYQSVHYMEQKYQAGSLSSTSRYYKLRKAGATVSQIMAYEAFHSKCHLVGSGDKDYVNYVDSNGNITLDGNQRLQITMAYCYYLNEGQRLPMIRQGQGHLINCYFDNSSHSVLQKLSVFSQYGQYGINHGMDARNGASIAADTCVYESVDAPIIGTEMQGDDTGSMSSPWDTLFENAYNHSLIVNSKITNSSGSTYTGSSWDNNGSNLFTSGFTWHDKSTIGNWAWSSSIDGAENMSKSDPPSTPFSFTYNYDEELPYSYQVLPLDSVASTVTANAGANKISMTAAKWTTIEYTSTATVSPSPSTSVTTASQIEEGLYMIKNVNSGLYLDVAGGTTANGTNVQQWGANSAASYNTWKIVSAGNGYYKLYSQIGDGSTYVLDVAGKKTTDGTNIEIYQDNDGNNQLFQFSQNSDGSYGILTKITNCASGLDVSDQSKSSGANIQQYSYCGNENQEFILEKVTAASASPSPSPSASSSPSPSPSASASPSTSTTTQSDVLDITASGSSWSGGYNLNVSLKNVSSSNITSWKLYLQPSETDISNIWCAQMTTSGSSLLITPENWNEAISSGGTVTFGFTANGTIPESLTYKFVYVVNGTEYTSSGTDSSL